MQIIRVDTSAGKGSPKKALPLYFDLIKNLLGSQQPIWKPLVIES